jgi:hypothetical protein
MGKYPSHSYFSTGKTFTSGTNRSIQAHIAAIYKRPRYRIDDYDKPKPLA